MFVEFLILDSHRDFAEQLNESTIRIVGEALVAGLFDQAGQRFVVQSQIQNRVHHSRHRHGGTRPDRDQQWVLTGPKCPARRRLQLGDLAPDCRQKLIRQFIRLQVLETCLGRDDESRRHVDADLSHLTQIRSLAAEQLLVMAVAVRKRIDVLFFHGSVFLHAGSGLNEKLNSRCRTAASSRP